MKNQAPLISAIIVTYNAERYLEEALQSVIGQSFGNFELIVIDGGSTDRTPEIVARHREAIGTWVSEPDRGIYDAMNKALDRASGEWVYFLGADDVLADPDVFDAIREQAAQADASTQMIFGKVTNYTGSRINSRYDAKLLLHNTLHHQSCFYRRSVFDGFRYDASLRMIADYELNLLLYRRKARARRVDRVIARCRDGGMSTSRSNHARFVAETNTVRSRHVGPVLNLFLRPAFTAKALLHHAV